VRVDLGVVSQAGGEQLAAHVPDGRRLQPVAVQAADREEARRGEDARIMYPTFVRVSSQFRKGSSGYDGGRAENR